MPSVCPECSRARCVCAVIDGGKDEVRQFLMGDDPSPHEHVEDKAAERHFAWLYMTPEER